jgi:DNA-directed RNA polymerase
MDEGETRLAAAPNFIHSMDAAHLAFVALACERENIPLLTVHDSFACLPCHADRLRKILLHELRKMYRDRDWLAELGPNRPPLGDLQIEEVRGRYAFS